ncbi:MFS transporter [Actinomadura monticuli]|uniref:MFS transporter n=1 Tax=Actinomadura monticuli TaxID=3097367 RepID=A0ABV4QLQ9_9ACTN
MPLRRNRNFTLPWSGQIISDLGTRVTTIAFPLLVISMTHSPAKAGIVGFCATLPYALFYLPAGALPDQYDRRRVMLICEVGRFLALGSLVVGAWALAAGGADNTFHECSWRFSRTSRGGFRRSSGGARSGTLPRLSRLGEM